MTIHTITAFFDIRDQADEAVTLLKHAGVADADVTLSPADARDEFATFDPLDRVGMPKHKGFWGMLEDLFGGSDDYQLYAEGVRRGSTMLTAHVDDDRLDQAVEILDRHGSIDLDEREISWRNEGWLGGSMGMPAGAPVLPIGFDLDPTAMPFVMPPPVEPAPVITPAAFATSAPVEAPVKVPTSTSTLITEPEAPASSGAHRDGDVLQVVEERLVVGKRSVSRGKVRVHSTVVETLATADIRLRDETVMVDRQPIDRAISADELRLSGFQDRTIEMEEVDEEAVVSKTIRVVEKIGLRKDVSNRTETVHGTLRGTKVEIEDERKTVVVEAEPFTSSASAEGVPIKPIRG